MCVLAVSGEDAFTPSACERREESTPLAPLSIFDGASAMTEMLSPVWLKQPPTLRITFDLFSARVE